MKREILFRARDINTGKWVLGFYSPVNLPVIGSMGHFINEGGFKAVEIDIETLGQYTGLLDGEGTKIFEGDTVTWNGRLLTVKYITKNPSRGCFRMVDNSDEDTQFTFGTASHAIKVIPS